MHNERNKTRNALEKLVNSEERKVLIPMILQANICLFCVHLWFKMQLHSTCRQTRLSLYSWHHQLKRRSGYSERVTCTSNRADVDGFYRGGIDAETGIFARGMLMPAEVYVRSLRSLLWCPHWQVSCRRSQKIPFIGRNPLGESEYTWEPKDFESKDYPVNRTKTSFQRLSLTSADDIRLFFFFFLTTSSHLRLSAAANLFVSQSLLLSDQLSTFPTLTLMKLYKLF